MHHLAAILALMAALAASPIGVQAQQFHEPAAEPAPAEPGEPDEPEQPAEPDPFEQAEMERAAIEFFGATSQGLAQLIERAFVQHGRPNAYIVGSEASGAIAVGLRYGEGTLHFRNGTTQQVYWQGPSVGWDFGGNASKVFTLVYDLRSTDQLFQRFPGVDGSLYFVAGFGMNYQKAGSVTLAPIRTGVGLRAGANVGYLNYTRERTWVPF